jgi:hypothetical protein
LNKTKVKRAQTKTSPNFRLYKSPEAQTTWQKKGYVLWVFPLSFRSLCSGITNQEHESSSVQKEISAGRGGVLGSTSWNPFRQKNHAFSALNRACQVMFVGHLQEFDSSGKPA